MLKEETGITMEGILLGIFSCFPEGKNRFKNDREKLYGFFLEQKNKYPLIFEGVNLPEFNGHYQPNDFDRAINRFLYNTKMLEAFGADWNPYIITDRCRKYIEKNVKNTLSPKKFNDLKKISLDFQKRFLTD